MGRRSKKLTDEDRRYKPVFSIMKNMATERERELVRVVKVKLRLNPDYQPSNEELVAMNAVSLDQEWNDANAKTSEKLSGRNQT